MKFTRPVKQKAPSVSSASKMLRRSCACGQHISSGEKCDACRQRDAGLQRSSGTAAASSVPPVVDEALQLPGQPLDADTRNFMEDRFGRDFSNVRIHADERADESARAVQANAYTVGEHIAFQSGRYDPSSGHGRQLLAHELTHVVQNQNSSQASGPVAAVSSPHDPAEREASNAAARVTGGEGVSAVESPAAVIHRDLSEGAAIGLGIAGGVVGAALIGVGIAALAGAFDRRRPDASAVPDLPADLVQRLQPACTSNASDAVRQGAVDALVAWARGQSSLGIDWSRVDWVRYDTSVGATGSRTDADDPQHIRLSLGPVAFSSVANLYSTFRHELVHTQEHETRPRAEVLSRGQGVQEVYAYLWELEHQRDTGLARRENWGLNPDGTADRSVGLARVVDGVFRAINMMGGDLAGNPNAVPAAEQAAIERRVACAMIATPREVVTAVLPGAPLEQWQRECSEGVTRP